MLPTRQDGTLLCFTTNNRIFFGGTVLDGITTDTLARPGGLRAWPSFTAHPPNAHTHVKLHASHCQVSYATSSETRRPQMP